MDQAFLATMANNDLVQSLQRGMIIIDLVARSGSGLTLMELVDALKALSEDGAVPVSQVAEAIKKYGIKTDKINPLYA